MSRWQSYTEHTLQYPTMAHLALRKHDAFISWNIKAKVIPSAAEPLKPGFL